jgi:ketosteroid isomerase-like protein
MVYQKDLAVICMQSTDFGKWSNEMFANGSFSVHCIWANLEHSDVRRAYGDENVNRRFYRFFLCTSCCILISAIVASATATTSNEVDQLIAIDKKQQRAYIDRDISILDAIFTDDYVLITSSGKKYTKNQVIEQLRTPDVQWEINETSGWEVRVRGDTGIVVATLRQKGVDHGNPFDNAVKFSDTYVRENGVWRNIHAHASAPTDAKR